ncbi:MAG: hypothetical protein GEV09_26670 [Pseudonocardiaceae bacterium]|nr:hypothetical protein [Pseudonocardiaceae bacterium]
MARLQGLTLRKSKRVDPNALDYGAWWVLTADRSQVVYGGTHGVTFEDVLDWLASPRDQRDYDSV